jgi:hypothetical protein
VVVLDLGRRAAKVVAVVPPKHALDYIAGDGDTVVYVELEGRPTDDSPRVKWTMKAVDLVTSSTTTIASSTGPVHYALAPAPSVRSPWVAWPEPSSVPDGQRVDSRVISYNLQTKQRVTLTEPGGSFAVAVAGSTVLYERNQPSDRGSYDVYAGRVDGSAAAVRLTSGGNAKKPYAGEGWIGWQADSGGYTSVWVMQYDGPSGRHGTPIDVDPRSEGNARLGDGFVIWLAFGGPLQLQPLPAGPTDAVLNIAAESDVNIAGNWDAWGHTIAWTGYDTRRNLVVNIATVSMQ